MVNGSYRTLQILAVITLLFACGCQEKVQVDSDMTKLTEVNLEEENARLTTENAKLRKQIQTLAGIDKTLRAESISSVSAIELTKRSKPLDKDKDGMSEMLRVCLRTMDELGDMIKAAGQVKIELWDLEANQEKALIQSWDISAAELKKTWSGTMLTSYYKLELDIKPAIEISESVVIRAEFIDYVTGKTFKTQR